jgi:hypothetical protein
VLQNISIVSVEQVRISRSKALQVSALARLKASNSESTRWFLDSVNLLTPWSRALLEMLIFPLRASIEISRLLWNRKVHHRGHYSSAPVPILRQINPIHTTETYYPKVNFNIILPSTPRYSEWSFPFRLSNQNNSRVVSCCESHLYETCLKNVFTQLILMFFLYFTLRQHVSEDYTSIIRSYNNTLVRIRDCNACPYNNVLYY